MVLVPPHPSGMKTANATSGPATRREVTMRAEVIDPGGEPSSAGSGEAAEARGTGVLSRTVCDTASISCPARRVAVCRGSVRGHRGLGRHVYSHATPGAGDPG